VSVLSNGYLLALTGVSEIDFDLSFVVIGGGGTAPTATYSGRDMTGGGGAGGYISSISGENSGGGTSAISTQSLTAEVGGGATTSVTVGAAGSDSVLSGTGFTHTALAGGSGEGDSGGSGSGGNLINGSGGAGTAGQGFAGADGRRDYSSCTNSGFFCDALCRNVTYTGSGGGAGAAGSAMNGGDGVQSSVTGTATYYAGGGGSRNICSTQPDGTGGQGSSNYGGGGGIDSTPQDGAVILRYPTTVAISNPGGGLTFTTSVVGSNNVTVFTAGTGNVEFAPA